MNNVIPINPLPPTKPTNHVFEAFDPHDPTKDFFLHAFYDEKGVNMAFVEDVGEPGSLNVRDSMWLDTEQAERFGKALLAAVRAIRA